MIAIVGAGGHTRSSLNIIKEFFSRGELVIYDDNFNPKEDEIICGIKVVGKTIDIPLDCQIFLSIGSNSYRKELFNNFKNQIIKENLIHKSSLIEEYVTIGKSNQIFANSFINSGVSIGDNNIINSCSFIEHESQIGSHNHISVGSKICGRVRIGDNCFIGAGSVIIDKIRICDDVIIGAGSVVIKDIVESGTYVGNPVRKIK